MSEITQELIEKIKEKISLGHYQADESFLLVIIPIIAGEIIENLEEYILSLSPHSNLHFADYETQQGERERELFTDGYAQAIADVLRLGFSRVRWDK